MFLTHCHHCGRRELAGERSIESLRNTDRGIEIRYRCRGCRQENVMRTGVGSRRGVLRDAV